MEGGSILLLQRSIFLILRDFTSLELIAAVVITLTPFGLANPAEIEATSHWRTALHAEHNTHERQTR